MSLPEIELAVREEGRVVLEGASGHGSKTVEEFLEDVIDAVAG